MEWALLPQKVLVGAGEVTESAGQAWAEVRGPSLRVRVCMDLMASTEKCVGVGGPGRTAWEWADEGPGQPLSWCLSVSG